MTTSTTGIQLTGLASGFDWLSLVDQLTDIQRTPQKQLLSEQAKLDDAGIAYGALVTQLGVLKNKVDALTAPSLYDSHTTATSDDTIATATASTSAQLGAYTFAISQLATASTQQGTANAGAPLSATKDVSGLVLSDAAFATAVTAGTFTVNGKIVTIATTDTLQQVFDKISTATSGAVTGSYNAATDQITLTGTGVVTLGSAADTSNFFQVARLYNTGTNSVASTAALGTVKLSAVLSAGNFATAVNDGGSGAGEFKINGVSIAFNAGTDTLTDVIARINNSTAGVTASYDAINDRLTLTNKTTGDVGLALEDVTGNFLAASGLSGGTLSRGQNLLYTVNGGGQLVSQSNTITADSSGLAGLSVTATATGSAAITVGSDAATIKTALADFVTEYNNLQSLIASKTATSTDDKGVVTAGVLAGDGDIANVASALRASVFGQVSGLTGVVNQLAQLGYQTNGNDDTLTLADSDALDATLAASLTGVKDFFTNATSGLAVKLSESIDALAGLDGSLVAHQVILTQQSTGIDDQIAALERIVQARRDAMIAQFIAMETAQAQINQQLQFLQARLGIPS